MNFAKEADETRALAIALSCPQQLDGNWRYSTWFAGHRLELTWELPADLLLWCRKLRFRPLREKTKSSVTLPSKLHAKIPNCQTRCSQWCNEMKVMEETKCLGVEFESCITRENAVPDTVNLV